jgi:threonine dehydratase
LEHCTVYAVEPDTAAPFALSKTMEKPCEYTNYKPSFVDGCGGKSVLNEMWPLANEVIDGGCAVPLKVNLFFTRTFI